MIFVSISFLEIIVIKKADTEFLYMSLEISHNIGWYK